MGFMTGTIAINFYDDSADTEFPLVNAPQISRNFKSTSALEVQTTIIVLPASGSQAISLNGLDTVTGIYIFSNATSINMNMNGLGNITIGANRPGYLPASISSCILTNTSSTTDTTVEITLVKES